MSVQPKPLQTPTPPLWNVVDKTPGFVVAAELGLKPMTWLRARNGLREAFSTYQEAATRVNGRPMALGEDCALLRTTFVAETMEEARRIAEGPLNQLCKYVGGVRARSIYLDPGEELTDEDNAKPWFDFLMDKDHILIGDPEFVAEKIRGIGREYQLESLLTLMAMPGLAHSRRDALHRALRREGHTPRRGSTGRRRLVRRPYPSISSASMWLMDTHVKMGVSLRV